MEVHRVAERHDRGHGSHAEEGGPRARQIEAGRGPAPCTLGGAGNKRPRADTALPDKLMALASRHWPRANGGRTSRRHAGARFTVARRLGAIPRNLLANSCGSSPNATAARHVNSMRRLVSRVCQIPEEEVRLYCEEFLALNVRLSFGVPRRRPQRSGGRRTVRASKNAMRSQATP